VIRVNGRFISLAVIIGLSGAGTASAETYVYQEKDGTRWITDRTMDPARFIFIQKYGRSTATRSCKGVTPGILEKRARRYMPAVLQYSQKNEVDAHLIKAMITVESCFDPQAVSRAGAGGLMQLMPATARQYKVLDRFNPDENLRAGIRHFRDLLDRFENNRSYSLAAYNAGAHNVEKHGGIPPFRETRDYVQRVFKYYEQYLQDDTLAGNP
jgi:soluble lytic murein transglycosylase-like protein